MDTAKSILIIDSQKASAAARSLLGTHYEVFLWADVIKPEFRSRRTELFKGRKLLIWPSACLAGREKAYEIAKTLVEHFVQIKIVHTWEAIA